MLREFVQDFDQRCVLFFGYSFLDMDIGSELYQLRRLDRGVHWYAVFPRDTMYRDKFSILQINRTFYDFMCDLDEAINFIPPEWKASKIPELRDKGLIQ